MRYIFRCILFALVPEVCVCTVQYLSIYLRLSILSIYLSMYLVCIYLYVPGPCRARGAFAGVCHVCVCVCVCVCVFVSFNCFVLDLFWVCTDRQVLSLDCSTGVCVGALGSESTMYTVNIIHEALEDGIHCGRLLEKFWMVCDEDWIVYLVAVNSKNNRLSLSLFTVNMIAIVTKPYRLSKQPLMVRTFQSESVVYWYSIQ